MFIFMFVSMDENFLITIFKLIGVDVEILVPSLMGALIAIKRSKSMSVLKSLSSMFFGIVCSVYLTPLVVNFLPLEWSIDYSIAFLVGYSGLSTLDLVFYLFNRQVDKYTEKKK